MNVSAVIVTRGDVPLDEILDSLPAHWQKVVWDNSQRQDLSVYGRYAAISECEHDLIYVQDDDVIVSPPGPEFMVEKWLEDAQEIRWRTADPATGRNGTTDHVVCNMPQEFRHDFYREHALVGFGGVFHRDAPERAFSRFFGDHPSLSGEDFRRDCDMIFTALTPRVLVDVPKRNLPWCDAPNRLWKQPDHQAKRNMLLQQVLKVRDG